MSSSPARRFQDHYAVLGIEPKSDSETIQQAYTKLAQRYHAKNELTGDPEQFEAVNIAYEVLSDPTMRREFDKLKGVGEETGTPIFSGANFFDAIVRERELRMALMSILYDRRRTKPFTPSLSMRSIENMLEAAPEEIVFTLWYLKQRGLATNDDKSSLQITVEGMDFLENNRPSPEIVMSFIKPAAMPSDQASAEPVKAAPPAAVAAPPKPAPAPPVVKSNASSSLLKINLALASKRRP